MRRYQSLHTKRVVLTAHVGVRRTAYDRSAGHGCMWLEDQDGNVLFERVINSAKPLDAQIDKLHADMQRLPEAGK